MDYLKKTQYKYSCYGVHVVLKNATVMLGLSLTYHTLEDIHTTIPHQKLLRHNHNMLHKNLYIAIIDFLHNPLVGKPQNVSHSSITS